MKNEEQIREAFKAFLKASMSLSHDMQCEEQEMVNFVTHVTTVLAWVLDERTFPGVKHINNLAMRFIAITDQYFTAEPKGGAE